ncbi:HTH domain-containing protein [Hyphomicrobiales bacterium]|nr:HTH domain-containing protein [Hyphomicrobiales bacterium]CAH1675793.1 HTH domain-containing protein [Hyphomicrobiales bacterium]
MTQSNLLAILQLFDGDAAVLTVEDIAREMGISIRTAYRNVRELSQAEFLDPVTGAGYALGPAFIHFDRLIRQNDPLIHIADRPMQGLLDKANQAAAVILCRRFRDRIMSVHKVDGAAPHLPASYERGAAMSLFVGAPAKAILAFLPDRALQALYLRHEEELRHADGPSWNDFRATLKEVRRKGFSATTSEVGSGRLGIAAPVFRRSVVVASLSLVLDAGLGSNAEKTAFYAEAVIGAAQSISAELDKHEAQISRP